MRLTGLIADAEVRQGVSNLPQQVLPVYDSSGSLPYTDHPNEAERVIQSYK